jgi:hypothetical protein
VAAGGGAALHAHANTWKVNGRPAIDVFVRRFEPVAVTAEEIIRLGLLGPQLRLEMQYVLQCRHELRATKTLPAVVTAVVRVGFQKLAAVPDLRFRLRVRSG